MDKKKNLLRRGKDKQGERRAECEERDRVDGVVIYIGFSVFYQTSFLMCNCCIMDKTPTHALFYSTLY